MNWVICSVFRVRVPAHSSHIGKMTENIIYILCVNVLLYFVLFKIGQIYPNFKLINIFKYLRAYFKLYQRSLKWPTYLSIKNYSHIQLKSIQGDEATYYRDAGRWEIILHKKSNKICVVPGQYNWDDMIDEINKNIRKSNKSKHDKDNSGYLSNDLRVKEFKSYLNLSKNKWFSESNECNIPF